MHKDWVLRYRVSGVLGVESERGKSVVTLNAIVVHELPDALVLLHVHEPNTTIICLHARTARPPAATPSYMRYTPAPSSHVHELYKMYINRTPGMVLYIGPIFIELLSRLC